jgi:hypothetical protein
VRAAHAKKRENDGCAVKFFRDDELFISENAN